MNCVYAGIGASVVAAWLKATACELVEAGAWAGAKTIPGPGIAKTPVVQAVRSEAA